VSDLRNVVSGKSELLEYASAEGVAKGAYVVCEASAEPKVILIGTGSELSVALEAREKLEADGIATRVVSMPCQEWFDEQDEEYRESVLPSSVTARVSVEAGIAMGGAMGANSLGFLLGGGVGGILLVIGVGLACGGFAWSRVIIRKAAP